jgi:hypothetical protein
MNGQTVSALADLLHADRVLLDLYNEAQGRVSSETATMLEGAVDDHRRHEETLVQALQDAEMQLAEPSEDMQALMAEHLRQVRGAREEIDVLQTIMLAERLNAMLYETAEREDLPEELSEVISAHHADERMHASLIAERTPYVSIPEHELACMTGGMTDDRNPDDFE